MVAADLKVGRVVGRRDLQRTRPELALDTFIGDHRHARLRPGHDHLATDVCAVSLVVWMHSDGDVGRNRRRPHSGDRDVSITVGERVADRRERVVDVLVLQLEV